MSTMYLNIWTASDLQFMRVDTSYFPVLSFCQTNPGHNMAIASSPEDAVLIKMPFAQAFEHTSTNVAASQMRNALNNLADTVNDPHEKKRFESEMDNFFALFRRYLNDKAKGNVIDCARIAPPAPEQVDPYDSLTNRDTAEVLTQLARVEGLHGDFAECVQLLDQAEPLAGSSAVANVRLELERGRMFRSSGDSKAAFLLFQDAFARASEVGEHFLAGDAAHMCAISVDDRKVMEDWTQRGLELGDREADAAYWAGPLLNNLAWAYHEDGDHVRALELFQRALEARERDPGNEAAIAFARYSAGVTLRALGRAEEALGMLEPAVAWARDAGKPDPEYEQELAEAQAALGRPTG